MNAYTMPLGIIVGLLAVAVASAVITWRAAWRIATAVDERAAAFDRGRLVGIASHVAVMEDFVREAPDRVTA